MSHNDTKEILHCTEVHVRPWLSAPATVFNNRLTCTLRRCNCNVNHTPPPPRSCIPYMAPEALAMAAPVSSPADVWSAGCLLAEMLLGSSCWPLTAAVAAAAAARSTGGGGDGAEGAGLQPLLLRVRAARRRCLCWRW
jgi:serine/threonine protein kinase